MNFWIYILVFFLILIISFIFLTILNWYEKRIIDKKNSKVYFLIKAIYVSSVSFFTVLFYSLFSETSELVDLSSFLVINFGIIYSPIFSFFSLVFSLIAYSTFLNITINNYLFITLIVLVLVFISIFYFLLKKYWDQKNKAFIFSTVYYLVLLFSFSFVFFALNSDTIEINELLLKFLQISWVSILFLILYYLSVNLFLKFLSNRNTLDKISHYEMYGSYNESIGMQILEYYKKHDNLTSPVIIVFSIDINNQNTALFYKYFNDYLNLYFGKTIIFRYKADNFCLFISQNLNNLNEPEKDIIFFKLNKIIRKIDFLKPNFKSAYSIYSKHSYSFYQLVKMASYFLESSSYQKNSIFLEYNHEVITEEITNNKIISLINQKYEITNFSIFYDIFQVKSKNFIVPKYFYNKENLLDLNKKIQLTNEDIFYVKRYLNLKLLNNLNLELNKNNLLVIPIKNEEISKETITKLMNSIERQKNRDFIVLGLTNKFIKESYIKIINNYKTKIIFLKHNKIDQNTFNTLKKNKIKYIINLD